MAHRWEAEKVQKWESKQSAWDLSQSDDLVTFLRELPLPDHFELQDIFNAKGGPTQLYRMRYGQPTMKDETELWHGTTYLGINNIIREGLRSSCEPERDEFTIPGVYLTDNYLCGLYYHGTATRFTARGCHWSTPYVRFLLRTAATGKPLKVSSYGEGRQLVYGESQVRVVEVLVFRGWNFVDAGEKVLWRDATEAPTLPPVQTTPWQVTQPKTKPPEVTPPKTNPPPPPPPLVWQAYMYICTTTQERTPYYYNIMTGVTTWVRPSEPFLPPPEQNVAVRESWQ